MSKAYKLLFIIILFIIISFIVSCKKNPSGIIPRSNLKLVYEVGYELYLVNSDGSGNKHLTSGIEPICSPTGNTIAFEGEGIYLIDIDGSNKRFLTARTTDSLNFNYRSKAWSPDGQQIIFASSKERTAEMSIINIDVQMKDE